jgi:hypothetical protein
MSGVTKEGRVRSALAGRALVLIPLVALVAGCKSSSDEAAGPSSEERRANRATALRVPPEAAYSAQASNEQKKLVEVRGKFLDSALERLVKVVNKDDRLKLVQIDSQWKENTRQWTIAASMDSWKKLDAMWGQSEATIVAIAKANDVKSKITITTYKGGEAKAGAIIKYQPVGTTEVTRANEFSVCTFEVKSIGRYHIWSERDGGETSSRTDAFWIVREEERVSLNESR